MIGPSNVHNNFMESVSTESIYDTAFKRRLIVELTDIEERVQRFNHSPDHLTDEIVQWREGFRSALNTSLEIRPIYDRYIGLLQSILVDSITQTPLDSKALLGNDGNCYAYKSVCLLYRSLPEEYLSRSPFNLEDLSSEDFTTETHEIARYMLTWLESHDSRLRSPDVDRLFQDLTDEIGERQIERLIPNIRNNRLRRIHQTVARRFEEAHVTQRFRENLAIVQTEIETEIRNEFDSLTERVDRFAKNAIHNLDDIHTKSCVKLKDLNCTVSHMNDEVESLQQETKKLEAQISYVSSDIETAKKEDLKVKLAIKKLEVAIVKRNKKRKAAIGTVIAIIGACALGTVLIQSLSGEGILAAVLPQKGGASLYVAVSL